jgi:hypothetical protein
MSAGTRPGTGLTWAEQSPSLFAARGQQHTYLLAVNDKHVVLTRSEGTAASAAAAAGQAALNAVAIPAGSGPERMAAMAGAKELARLYESGQDTGLSAWRRPGELT